MNKPKLCSTPRGARWAIEKDGSKLVIEALGQRLAEVYSAEVGRDICTAVNRFKPSMDAAEIAVMSLKTFKDNGCSQVELLDGALEMVQSILTGGLSEQA